MRERYGTGIAPAAPSPNPSPKPSPLPHSKPQPRGLFYDAVCNAVLLPIYGVFLPVFLRRFCADFFALDFAVWRGVALA
jgi:hypothetical protein